MRVLRARHHLPDVRITEFARTFRGLVVRPVASPLLSKSPVMSRIGFTVCLLLALRTVAAPVLDAPREALERTEQSVRGLVGRQAALRGELNPLSARIEALKRHRAPLGKRGGLDEALRKSQELSQTLEEIAIALVTARGREQAAAGALDGALAQSIMEKRRAWEAARTVPERRSLANNIRTLWTERERLRAFLPVERLPGLNPNRESENPGELLEQADALRDTEDKVRLQLVRVNARLADVRDERALEERMNAFVGTEALMDEQSSALRVTRSGSVTSIAPLPGTSPAVAAGVAVQPPTTMAAPGTAGSSAPGVGSVTRPAATPPTRTGQALQEDNVNGTLDVRHPPGAAGLSDDVASLEAQGRKLRSLADSLAAQAHAAEERARSLR